MLDRRQVQAEQSVQLSRTNGRGLDLLHRDNTILSRGGAVAARRAHNPKVVGSNPTPATKKLKAGQMYPEVRLSGLSFRPLAPA